MTKKILNQNDIINTEILNSYDLDGIFSNNPINRLKSEPTVEDKTLKLKNLKEKIQSIDDCKLKENGSNSHLIASASCGLFALILAFLIKKIVKHNT